MLLPVVVLEVRLEVLAPGAHRVPGVQHLQQDVARIDHLVQFAPDSLRLSLLEHRVAHRRPAVHAGVGCHRRRVPAHAALLLVLLRTLRRVRHQRLVTIHVPQLWLFPRLLRPERCRERLHRSQTRPSHLSAFPLLRVRILHERQRQLLLLQNHRVWVVHFGRHLLPERLQLLLADDARVAKPSSVGLDPGRRQLFGLKVLGDDASLLVPLRLLVPELEELDGGRGPLAVLVLRSVCILRVLGRALVLRHLGAGLPHGDDIGSITYYVLRTRWWW